MGGDERGREGTGGEGKGREGKGRKDRGGEEHRESYCTTNFVVVTFLTSKRNRRNQC
jgi:hypothetical protein